MRQCDRPEQRAEHRSTHPITSSSRERPVNVLVPPRYREDARPYPVIYLFHGAFSDEDSFSTQTDLLAFTASLRDEDQAIAVMPFGRLPPREARLGRWQAPARDVRLRRAHPVHRFHYRSLPDRAHRAAAGFSAGGLDAMIFAARHPDTFVAAGSFSGFVDPFTAVGEQVVQQFASVDEQLCGANVSWLDLWGDPVAHPMGWEAHDPVYVAENVRDLALYIGSDNGVPCPDEVNPDPFLEFAETTVYGMSQTLDSDLTALRIPHVTDFRSCGIHEFSNSNHDLRRFWPQMLSVLGAPAPREFSYRAGDASESVWGWTFTADPARAPEFLDVAHASAQGLKLTGSGHEAGRDGARRCSSPGRSSGWRGRATGRRSFAPTAEDGSSSMSTLAQRTRSKKAPRRRSQLRAPAAAYFVTREIPVSARRGR